MCLPAVVFYHAYSYAAVCHRPTVGLTVVIIPPHCVSSLWCFTKQTTYSLPLATLGMDLAHLMCDCRYVVSTDAILFITPRGFCSIAENSFHPIQYSLYQCTTQNLQCRDCPVSRCVELLIVVLTLDSYLSLCRLVIAY